jgi:hypothetical protein
LAPSDVYLDSDGLNVVIIPKSDLYGRLKVISLISVLDVFPNAHIDNQHTRWFVGLVNAKDEIGLQLVFEDRGLFDVWFKGLVFLVRLMDGYRASSSGDANLNRSFILDSNASSATFSDSQRQMQSLLDDTDTAGSGQGGQKQRNRPRVVSADSEVTSSHEESSADDNGLDVEARLKRQERIIDHLLQENQSLLAVKKEQAQSLDALENTLYRLLGNDTKNIRSFSQSSSRNVSSSSSFQTSARRARPQPSQSRQHSRVLARPYPGGDSDSSHVSRQNKDISISVTEEEESEGEGGISISISEGRASGSGSGNETNQTMEQEWSFLWSAGETIANILDEIQSKSKTYPSKS